ncbi:MAG: PQQ-dependent sugar dehydrogenase [Chloroflexi bacterium]|nr:PQQ-dependent sugar dehydrogenase [Chloroflexota bacterium]
MTTRGPRRALAIVLIAAFGTSACSLAGTASPSPTRGGQATPTVLTSPSAEPSPEPSATPHPTPAPTPTPAPFDPTAVSITLETIATVPGRPLAIANVGDASGRLFVAEQGGRVYIVEDRNVNGTPFLDVSDQVSGGGEQGLLGLAFHADYPDDPRVFIYYTNTGGDIVVSSFDVDPGAPDVVVPGSESVILTIEHSQYGNHNGGGLLFGPDGYLYVATGDGGGGGDPYGSGQNLDTLLAKILRLDVDINGVPYGSPGTNPYVGRGGRDEIWLTGLRNPFRFSFDRDTGDLWIGDVGQNRFEEIDVARSGVDGLNFGWKIMEGAACFSPSSGCPQDGLTLPVVQYDHDLGLAVIGGYVYRGPQAVLRGGYIFSDNYSGRIWAVAAAGDGAKALVQVGQAAVGVAGYGEDEAGELYAADLDGSIYRVVGTTR